MAQHPGRGEEEGLDLVQLGLARRENKYGPGDTGRATGLLPVGGLKNVLPQLEAAGINPDELYGGTAADRATENMGPLRQSPSGRVGVGPRAEAGRPAPPGAAPPAPAAAAAGAGPQARLDAQQFDAAVMKFAGVIDRILRPEAGRGRGANLPTFEGPAGPYRPGSV